MAKIVLAGPANDPYLPRCELLADQLKSVLPDFDVHKIFIQPSDWEEWLQNTCSKFGWRRKEDNKGPIVWRELVNRGGKAVLIGDSNDFQEFCRTYYSVRSNLVTNYMLRVGAENQTWTNLRDAEEQIWEDSQNPVVISFWNATAEAAQLMAGKIAIGGVLPYDDMEFRLAVAPWMLAPVARPPNNETADGLHVLAGSSLESVVGDSSSFIEQLAALEGIQANLEDMACGAVRRVVNCGGNAISSAVGAKLVIIVIDDSCNSDNSAESFRILGRDLENTLAGSQRTGSTPKQDNSTRVLFVSSNVECMNRTLFRIASNFVGGILSTVTDDIESDPYTVDYKPVKGHHFFVDPAKVLCLTTSVENAAKSLVAKQLNVTTSLIHNLVVWSRPEDQTTFPWPFYVDITQAAVADHHGAIEGPAPFTRMVMDLLAHERKFITGIHDAVSARYIVSSGKSLAVTHAATDFLRGWFGGAEKHPNILVEQFRRGLVFSVGICKFVIPPNANPRPAPPVGQTQPEPPKESMIGYKSVPIRFLGRDNLDGTGYVIMEAISPPADMYVIPQAAKPTEENAANQPTDGTAQGETNQDGEAAPKEMLPSVDEVPGEEGGQPSGPVDGDEQPPVN